MPQAINGMSVTWTSGATENGIKLNVTDTSSSASSNLMDLQVGGASRFSVSKAGAVSLGSPSIVSATHNLDFYSVNGAYKYFSINYSAVSVDIYRGFTFRIESGTSNTFAVLAADAADTLAQRNGTTAQTFRVYNTYTDTLNNFERGKIAWESNVLRIGTEKGAVAGTARALELQTDGTTRLTIAAAGSATFAGRALFTNGSTTAPGISFDVEYGLCRGIADGLQALFIQSAANSGIAVLQAGGSPVASLGVKICSTLYFSSALNVASDALIARTASGKLRISPFLSFEGTSSSFPALKRDTVRLQARLADDSDFTNIQGKLTTETPYTAGAPTATGYLVLYDSNGTAYKVPAVAL